MRVLAYIALLSGLATAIILVATHGLGTVASAFAALGAGVLLLPLVYAPHLAGAAASWSLLFPPGRRPPFGAVLRAIWVGLSVEALLPAASLGAEAAKVRMLTLSGVRAHDAVTSVVVDMTVQAFVLAFWGIIGTAALFCLDAEARFGWAAMAGAAMLAIGFAGFLLAQRAGLFGFLARMSGKAIRAPRWQAIIGDAGRLDATVRLIYARPRRIVLAWAIRCLTRGFMAVELLVAADLMGHPIPPADALMLVGIIGTLRAATVVVPGAWGIQEGGFVILGGLVGLPPDIMLALSLATRARELMLGLPALAFWQIREGRLFAALVRHPPPGRADEPQSWTQPNH